MTPEPHFVIPDNATFDGESDLFPEAYFPTLPRETRLGFLYQPIIDPFYKLIGIEALARGFVGDADPILPHEFIPSIENSTAAERWLLTRLAEDSWKMPHPSVKCFVNVSPNALGHLTEVAGIVKFQNPLVIDITERLRNPNQVEDLGEKIGTLRKRLDSLGVNAAFALDDITEKDLVFIKPLLEHGLEYIKLAADTFPIWRMNSDFWSKILGIVQEHDIRLVMEGYDAMTRRTFLDGIKFSCEANNQDDKQVLAKVLLQGFGVSNPILLDDIAMKVTSTESEGEVALCKWIMTDKIADEMYRANRLGGFSDPYAGH